MCEGLEEKITLQWGKFTRVQILDYEGVPFCCQRCHRVGHIFKDCHLIKKSEDPPKASLAPSRIDSPVVQPSPVLGPFPPTSDTLPKSVDEVHRSNSPPLTRSRAAAEAAKASGIPLTSLSPSIAFCTSFVPPSIITSMAQCTMATPPSIFTTTPSLQSSSTSSSSPSSNRISSSHHYNIRSHILSSSTMGHLAGLGLTLPGLASLTTWGRKLDLSKAIKRARDEVTFGH